MTFERSGRMGKYTLERMPDPSDVTDEEWARLEPLLPAAKPGGRPQEIERGGSPNAGVVGRRSGWPAPALRQDFDPVVTADWCFRQPERTGVWESVHAGLA